MTRLASLGALVFGLIVSTLVAESKPQVNATSRGLAMDGYDAVAYFADGKPTRGSAQFEMRWNGATWRFATAANRDAFQQRPDHFAPQFGGYCAYAVSRGYTANGDPRVWKLVDGRLYLNYSTSAQALWEKDIPANIAKGRGNWPSVLER
jgi:hypothetical protein